MLVRKYNVRCDGCASSASYRSFETSKDVRRYATASGWKRVAGRDYCTRCLRRGADIQTG